MYRILLGCSLLALVAGCSGGRPLDRPSAAQRDASIARVKAGVAVVDMTPPVGYSAGQYTDFNQALFTGLLGGALDPNVHATLKKPSVGVQSRLTARVIVVEGNNGQRIALLKTDNYLAQDMLLRRVGQLLDQGSSGVAYPNILHHVTHNHSSAYASTLSIGVWLFEDVWDFRFFEFQARKIAQAIEAAAADLRPARMGATELRHHIFKGNVTRTASADDGTPAGYPREYGDHGLAVLRFDDMSDPANPQPLAVWANFGEHPESLDAHDLHSADFLAPLERFVDRDLGVPLVFAQGDVGGAESSGNPNQLLDDTGRVCGLFPGDAEMPERDDCPAGQGVLRDWNHAGFVQNERVVRYLADDIVRAFEAIGRGEALVPYSSDFPVLAMTRFVPGPLSHPYPGVSNCNTDRTVSGSVGVPAAGLPDCQRTDLFDPQASLIVDTLRAEGIPVPDHYDAPAFAVVEENLRLMLQTFALGDVLLASCACEAQADLILNLETRGDSVVDNQYNGFDWACLLDDYRDDPAYAKACVIQQRYFDVGQFPTDIPGDNFSPEAIAHMRAQIHGDASGWDDPANVLNAGSEAPNPADIRGNFSHEEIQDLGAPGFPLVIGVGHAGDYNGYTVSYREYMNRDHYRKALTAYGPHTADYMVTRLVRMAASLQTGQDLDTELLGPLAAIDEARQASSAVVLGQLTGPAYSGWRASLPAGADAPAVCDEALCGFDGTARDIEQFDATSFSWLGGNNAIDNPTVSVWQLHPDGRETLAADMSGEVQTQLTYPNGIPGLLASYSGTQRWIWTANFEAYRAFPARLGGIEPGTYQFKVQGNLTDGLNQSSSYLILSNSFIVSPYPGPRIGVPERVGNRLQFEVPELSIPRSYASVFGFITDDGGQRICETCTFRPWATGAAIESVQATAIRGGQRQMLNASRDEEQQWSVGLGEPLPTAVEIQALYVDGQRSPLQIWAP